ncbi:MAG: inositol monophosphatase [candidate division WOR-3 bacterium]|nr:inositol monophosphatase [candidate division WOR-3 bacterium]
MEKIKLDEILNKVIKVIVSTGDRIYRLSSGRKHVSYKGAVNLVTRFDKISQKRIVEYLKKQFPDYGILSEEDVNYGTSREIKWLVDPLDGTTNFAHDLPIWAISIGLEVEGEVVLGVVYDPTRKELFSALKGKGAFLNGKKISVSKTKKLGHSLLVTGFPYDIRESKDNNLNYFARFCLEAQAVRRLGSAALDLCYTACGRFDGYWEIKLAPWDQAAGSLILKEAGGMITDFKGRPFNIYGKEVLGSNGYIHTQMMDVLNRRSD